MDMSKINVCDATQCAYNRDNQCHALAITVGDSAGPRCDTYLSGGMKGGDPSTIGKVGACKMSPCKHNEMLECAAGAIRVVNSGDKANCTTFEPR